jgi:hypothetical protein
MSDKTTLVVLVRAVNLDGLGAAELEAALVVAQAVHQQGNNDGELLRGVAVVDQALVPADVREHDLGRRGACSSR